jgi:hypothetical protein
MESHVLLLQQGAVIDFGRLIYIDGWDRFAL